LAAALLIKRSALLGVTVWLGRVWAGESVIVGFVGATGDPLPLGKGEAKGGVQPTKRALTNSANPQSKHRIRLNTALFYILIALVGIVRRGLLGLSG
jgi:hypothetical protein